MPNKAALPAASVAPARRTWQRQEFVDLINTALALGEARFTQAACFTWLGRNPGDLEIAYLQAQAWWQGNHTSLALAAAERLCNLDPEFVPAHRLLGAIYQRIGSKHLETVNGVLTALNEPSLDGAAIPEWGRALRACRQALSGGEIDRAGVLLQAALAADPPTPLAALTHLQLLRLGIQGQPSGALALRAISAHYHQRWSDSLTIALVYAEVLLDSSEEERGVALLHQTAAQDLTGQAARRLWGAGHPYQALWAEPRSLTLDIPLPAALAARYGWNALASGSPAAIEAAPVPVGKSMESALTAAPASLPPRRALPETLQNTQAELQRIAERLNQPELTRSEGRFPVYVIFSTRQGLVAQYGAEGLAAVQAGMQALKSVMDTRPRWRACIFIADDPTSTAESGVKPCQATDAWGLKLALADLDESLSKRGEMIGALLIVGGPQIVPFHHLPNPLDDSDLDVPSDNPYATRDENYFVCEWPVGRLPGDASKDPQPLVRMLNLAALHQVQAQSATRQSHAFTTQLLRLWRQFTQIVLRQARRLGLPASQSHPEHLGFTAAIWQQAAQAVYQPLGAPDELLVSPPSSSAEYQKNGYRSANWAYFNLHGVVDASDWYGHNDPLAPQPGPDYPVALRPQDIGRNGKSPRLVFSEACYGGHIQGHSLEQSIALKFLAAGAYAFVGSTVTAYGSVTTPLIAADLLGRTFWSLTLQGVPSGEALRRAKIALVNEMDRRQGYLDGEDQKTLISFVLYGDPLAQPLAVLSQPKEVLRPLQPPQIKTVCDRADHTENVEIPPETLATVKRVVHQYLPGMQDAALAFSHIHSECLDNDGICPTRQFGAKTRLAELPARQVVMLSKQVRKAQCLHQHYARLTLNPQGKVIKLAISR